MLSFSLYKQTQAKCIMQELYNKLKSAEEKFAFGILHGNNIIELQTNVARCKANINLA